MRGGVAQSRRDRMRLQLAEVDVAKAYIDFARADPMGVNFGHHDRARGEFGDGVREAPGNLV